jgi:hypothetical protein
MTPSIRSPSIPPMPSAPDVPDGKGIVGIIWPHVSHTIATVAPPLLAVAGMALLVDNLFRLTVGNSNLVLTDASSIAEPAFLIGKRLQFRLVDIRIGFGLAR